MNQSVRENCGNTVDAPVPSAAWKSGDFSSYLTGVPYTDTCTGATYDEGQLFDPTTSHIVTCTNSTQATVRDPIAINGKPNVINPAEISQAASGVLDLFHAATTGNTFIWSPVLAYNCQRGNGEMDYQWGSHDRITGHYSILDAPPAALHTCPLDWRQEASM